MVSVRHSEGPSLLGIKLGLGLVELGSGLGLALVLGLAMPFGMTAWNPQRLLLISPLTESRTLSLPEHTVD